jgi:thymidylate kinase
VRLIAVSGASPGIGKSVLCQALAGWLTQAGLSVDHFEEDHVLRRPAFARVADDFQTTGRVRPRVLVDATVRYLRDAAADGTDVVVMDSLVPYVPSLLASGHHEQEITRIVSELAVRIGSIPVLIVFLDGDAVVGLRRASAREGEPWLRWYAAKLLRYGLIGDHQPDLATLREYLSHERATTLRVLQRQPWQLLIAEHADTTAPADLFATVRASVEPFLAGQAPAGPQSLTTT